MFKIVTDSTADLPVEYLKEHDLGCMNLSYIMDGVTYGQGQELPEKEFYALMRQGKMPTTSQRGTAGPQGSDFERSGQIHGRSGRVGEE